MHYSLWLRDWQVEEERAFWTHALPRSKPEAVNTRLRSTRTFISTHVLSEKQAVCRICIDINLTVASEIKLQHVRDLQAPKEKSNIYARNKVSP